MKINLLSKILNLKGEPILTKEDGKEVDLILKYVCTEALMNDIPKGQNQPLESGREKMKRYKIAQKIEDNDEVDLTVEEVKIIKDQVGQLYGTKVACPAIILLDPAEEDGKNE